MKFCLKKINVLLAEANKAGSRVRYTDVAIAAGYVKQYGNELVGKMRKGLDQRPEVVGQIWRGLEKILGRSVELVEFVADEDLPAAEIMKRGEVVREEETEYCPVSELNTRGPRETSDDPVAVARSRPSLAEGDEGERNGIEDHGQDARATYADEREAEHEDEGGEGEWGEGLACGDAGGDGEAGRAEPARGAAVFPVSPEPEEAGRARRCV